MTELLPLNVISHLPAGLIVTLPRFSSPYTPSELENSVLNYYNGYFFEIAEGMNRDRILDFEMKKKHSANPAELTTANIKEFEIYIKKRGQESTLSEYYKKSSEIAIHNPVMKVIDFVNDHPTLTPGDKLGWNGPIFLINVLNEVMQGFADAQFYSYLKKSAEESSDNSELSFLNLFKTTSHCNYIRQLLVKEGYCQPHTYHWKDEGKGSLSLLVAIIKQLSNQGYYRGTMPTHEQIIVVCKNSFKRKVSLSTVKQSNTQRFDLSFIPLASTLKA